MPAAVPQAADKFRLKLPLAAVDGIPSEIGEAYWALPVRQRSCACCSRDNASTAFLRLADLVCPMKAGRATLDRMATLGSALISSMRVKSRGMASGVGLGAILRMRALSSPGPSGMSLVDVPLSRTTLASHQMRPHTAGGLKRCNAFLRRSCKASRTPYSVTPQSPCREVHRKQRALFVCCAGTATSVVSQEIGICLGCDQARRACECWDSCLMRLYKSLTEFSNAKPVDGTRTQNCFQIATCIPLSQGAEAGESVDLASPRTNSPAPMQGGSRQDL